MAEETKAETAIAKRDGQTVATTTVEDMSWLKEFSEKIKKGESIERLVEEFHFRTDRVAGDFKWIRPEKGTVVIGKLLGYKDIEQSRVDKDSGAIEKQIRRNYMMELLATPTSILARGGKDPTPEEAEGREIVTREDGGETFRYVLAREGDAVMLGEISGITMLAERIGCVAIVEFKEKRGMKSRPGQKFWDVAVRTKGTPIAGWRPATKALAAGSVPALQSGESGGAEEDIPF